MAAIGPLPPSTAASYDTAGATWSNPDNARFNDGLSSTTNLISGGADSDRLSLGAWQGLPRGELPLGFEVTVNWSRSGPGVCDFSIGVSKNLVNYTGNAPFVDGTPGSGTTTLGSPTDLWGHTWTPDEIDEDHEGFFVLITASGATGGDVTYSMNWVTLTMYPKNNTPGGVRIGAGARTRAFY